MMSYRQNDVVLRTSP